MSEEPLTILEATDVHDVQYLEDRLYDYSAARTGFADSRLLTIFVRDDAGVIMAGLHGWTWGECCEVRFLWVHEAWRGRRMGTRLMAAAEAEARQRGAKRMILSTHSFQAPDFYRRIGFEQVGQVDDYPTGYQNIMMAKVLR